jgi:integrase
MFDLALDSKLRACDIVALKVGDIAPNGYSTHRATIRQKKTGQSVKFDLTEQTRQAVDDYLRGASRRPGEFLFIGRYGSPRSITTRQYARLVSRMAGWHRPRPAQLRHPFTSSNEGNADLSPHGQFESCSAPPRPQED